MGLAQRAGMTTPPQMTTTAPAAHGTITAEEIQNLLADLNIDSLIASLEGEPQAASPAPVVARPRAAESERRAAPRHACEELPTDVRLTIPGAADVAIVNISETGALIETSRRLSPGTTADLFVRLNGRRHALRATTVRSALHSIQSGVVYRTALQFEQRLPLEAH
ncbi:MAG: PilZ domain-containing protein [Acidobacteria bacterium]|nr:PilZ domain-containing protein [Acidobacteriota bacterium]